MAANPQDANGSATKTATGAGSAGDFPPAVVAALADAAGKVKPPPDADPKVVAALQLGWLMKDLNAGTPIEELDGLPLDSEVGFRAQGTRLAVLIKTLEIDDDQSAALVSSLTQFARPVADQAQVWAPHAFALLLGNDARLSRAYQLGLGLHELRDRTYTPAVLSGADPQRLVNELDQLTSGLPPHAGRSVALSLTRWIKHPPAQTDQLADQCDQWYRVLSGQKKATELLEPENYIDAAERLARKFSSTALLALRRTWAVVILALGLFAVGVVLLLVAGGSPTTTTATGFSVILAGIGLTWKGIGGTIGKLVGRLEAPLWNAEVEESVAGALTLLDVKPKFASVHARRRAIEGGDYAGRAKRLMAEEAPPGAPAATERSIP